jgi:crotonobetainyl-CoA:carnitine CoA-transferase CaiB-like acyl-CoA transferase
MGNRLEEFVPYGTFATSDGHVAIAIVGDHHWEILCDEVERPDLADRYPTVHDRRDHRVTVESELQELFRDASTDTWCRRLAPDVPIAPVNDLVDVWESEHVCDRGVIQDRTIDGVTFPIIAYPVSFSQVSTDLVQGVPRLGEHTVSELLDLGYEREAIEALHRKGIIESTDSHTEE